MNFLRENEEVEKQLGIGISDLGFAGAHQQETALLFAGRGAHGYTAELRNARSLHFGTPCGRASVRMTSRE
jgi:hypothetical protein